MKHDDLSAADQTGEAYLKSRAATDKLREPYESHMHSAARHEQAIKDAKRDIQRRNTEIQAWEKEHPLRARFGWESKEIKRDRQEIDRQNREIPQHEQSFAKHAAEADKLFPGFNKSASETELLRKEHERSLAPERNTGLPPISSDYLGIPKGPGTDFAREEAHRVTIKEAMGRVVRPPMDNREQKHGYDL